MGVLRLLLALSVLTAHMKGKSIFGFRLLYGDQAVECFFMVSGFYMALVLNEKYDRPGDYLPFLWQRILRLYPAYLIVLFLTIVTLGLVSLAAGSPQSFYQAWFTNASILSPSAWFYFIFTNLFIVGKQLSRFQGLDPQTGDLTFHATPNSIGAMDFSFVPQAWTLDLELMFYLIAPLLVRRHIGIQILLVAATFALRLTTYEMFAPGRSPFYMNSFFPYELFFFMLGSVAYQIYRHQEPLLRSLKGFYSWFHWVFFIAILYYSRLPGTSDMRFYLFLPVLFLMLPLLFYYTKDNATDRLIGELSYPFYLVHVLVLTLMRPWVKDLPFVVQGPLYAAVAMGTAYLLYRLIEHRIDDYRHRLFARQRRTQPTVTSTETKAVD